MEEEASADHSASSMKKMLLSRRLQLELRHDHIDRDFSMIPSSGMMASLRKSWRRSSLAQPAALRAAVAAPSGQLRLAPACAADRLSSRLEHVSIPGILHRIASSLRTF